MCDRVMLVEAINDMTTSVDSVVVGLPRSYSPLA